MAARTELAPATCSRFAGCGGRSTAPTKPASPAKQILEGAIDILRFPYAYLRHCSQPILPCLSRVSPVAIIVTTSIPSLPLVAYLGKIPSMIESHKENKSGHGSISSFSNDHSTKHAGYSRVAPKQPVGQSEVDSSSHSRHCLSSGPTVALLSPCLSLLCLVT